MNNERLTLQFIKSLTERTLKNQISWQYLDSEDKHQLAYNLELVYRDPYNDYVSYNFNTDESFSFTSDEQNMNIVLYTSEDDNALNLIIVPFTFKHILKIDGSEYLSALVELLNAIKRQFPNPYDFMENFIKD